MDLDTDRIDDAVPALLYLNLQGTRTAWKGLSRDALDRLHERGLISNPAKKTKSVWLTEEAKKAAEQICGRLFAKA